MSGHRWGTTAVTRLARVRGARLGERVPRVEEDYPRVHVRRTSRRGVSLPNEALDHLTFSHRTAAVSGLAS